MTDIRRFSSLQPAEKVFLRRVANEPTLTGVGMEIDLFQYLTGQCPEVMAELNAKPMMKQLVYQLAAQSGVTLDRIGSRS